MRRDVAGLSTAHHDVVIVGGGIHGLFAAYDAASRGLSVALVEQGDFGGGLSFNHQRTIHGGLQDLAAGRVGAARRRMVERRAWARMAPHFIRPLPFLAATYRFTARSRLRVRARFALYDVLGRSRNAGVPSELHLPKAKLESAAATRRLFPGVAAERLSGGSVWYDYHVEHADRLNWVVAAAAMRAGAKLINYVEAIGPLRKDGRVAGVRVRDHLSGAEHDITAAVTLLAVGSEVSRVQELFGIDGAAPVLARAMNLLLDRPARDIATVASSRSGRTLTVVPSRGYALVGSSLSSRPVDRASFAPTDGEIDDMLADVRTAFPALRADRAAIRLIHHGRVPVVVRRGRVELPHDPVVVRHAAGLVSLVGARFATARLGAQKAIDAVAAEVGRTVRRCSTGSAPLPYADIADAEGRLAETLRATGAELDRDVTTHLTSWYGTEAPAVVEFGVRANLLRRIPDSVVLAAEIAYAVEHADARHLSDVVLRRTPLGAVGHPGPDALAAAADVMGDRLAWTPAQRAEEIAGVERRYPAPATVR
jgi:glycerol-3-phosphate dehydrogenase